MSEVLKYKDEFENLVRMRGMNYFRLNKVKTVTLVPGQEAVFKVYGSKIYTVQLQLNQGEELVSQCTCPYFEKGYRCKHEWAAMLEAQKNAFFNKSQDLSTKAVVLKPHSPLWRDQIQNLKHLKNNPEKQPTPDFYPTNVNSRIGFFVIDTAMSAQSNKWVMKFYASEYLKNGTLGKIKPFSVGHKDIDLYEDDLDRKALWSVLGMSSQSTHNYYSYEQKKDYVYLQTDIMAPLLEELSNAKKLLMLNSYKELENLVFSMDPVRMKLDLVEGEEGFLLKSHLFNVTRKFPTNLHSSFYIQPYLLSNNDLMTIDFEERQDWFSLFKYMSELSMPNEDVNGFLDFYFQSQNPPALTYPATLKIKDLEQFTKVRLAIDKNPDNGQTVAEIQFLYGTEFLGHEDSRMQVFRISDRTLFKRDFSNEQIEISKIEDQFNSPAGNGKYYIDEGELEKIILLAFELGWEVIAFKQNVHSSKEFKAAISSGQDWFDLRVDFEFQNGSIFNLPQLLQGIKSGKKFISLGDGSVGIVPQEWINKFSSIAQAGIIDGESIRLTKIQALFHAHGLSDDKNFQSDKKFKSFQKIIEDINKIEQVDLHSGFKGKLRKYQKTGVSWLSLMSKHEIGTILADDMGLGKTVQVLATISKPSGLKSLIVAPKSLVFNWINEAKRFTPHLKFHDHTGSARMDRLLELEDSDIIITTYQTFRQDIEFFKERSFEYFILDEAHYIKNSESQAYMACKIINAKKKIALTGTPVENSLKDLFSILSVVTPGLISESLSYKYANEMDPDAIRILSKSLQPFILRRTKDEVLKDLPKKSEQVLYCELTVPERKKYDELKIYYWNNLNSKIKERGFQRSKIEILEALLRLRQASCHTGLLNNAYASQSSAKFELLLEQVENVIQDGHKALIFSQFTSLLGLFGQALSKRQINFEYLDGKTSNRSERVKNFQENKDIPIFLISLKAGGVGLNLTSADYVFILDPWWNPAAESQAIDRARRYGQTKKVFAYKIIAKDTVEEKILALQEKKRALAKAVISADKSLLKGIKMEDLRELFS